MFNGATKFNQQIGMWNTSNVLRVREMFKYAKTFNQPLSWNANKVTTMNYMFDGATAFNQDISSWRSTTNSVDAAYMLRNTAMSEENYCKVASTWNYSGALGLEYTCH